jgi:hypothetical protein
MIKYECVHVNSRIGLRHRVVIATCFGKAAAAIFDIAAKSVYGRNALVRGITCDLIRNDSIRCYTGWIGYNPAENLCVSDGKNIQITIKEKS